MGQELTCTLRFDGRAAEGKAVLETDFLLFRGTPRLRISFAEMKKVDAKDGALRVRFPAGLAVFELGDAAAMWAEKILHPKGRAAKLGVKEGTLVAMAGARDEAFESEIAPLARTVALHECELLFFGANVREDLADLPGLKKVLGAKTALWIVYPKGREEIRERDVLAAGRAAGLTDIKVVRFSETHTALKFVRPVKK